jgi:hypothetical protein
MINPPDKILHLVHQLNDALCEWERNCGQPSVLILRIGGWRHQSMDGKPIIDNPMADNELLELFKQQGQS